MTLLDNFTMDTYYLYIGYIVGLTLPKRNIMTDLIIITSHISNMLTTINLIIY